MKESGRLGGATRCAPGWFGCYTVPAYPKPQLRIGPTTGISFLSISFFRILSWRNWRFGGTCRWMLEEPSDVRRICLKAGKWDFYAMRRRIKHTSGSLIIWEKTNIFHKTSIQQNCGIFSVKWDRLTQFGANCYTSRIIYGCCVYSEGNQKVPFTLFRIHQSFRRCGRARISQKKSKLDIFTWSSKWKLNGIQNGFHGFPLYLIRIFKKNNQTILLS